MATSIRQRALHEMRHRAIGAGFRYGRYSGPSPRELRADALSRRAELVAGRSLVARDPHALGIGPVGGLLALGAGVAIGYAIGKWLKKSSNAYLHGVDVQTNRYLVGSLVLAQ